MNRQDVEVGQRFERIGRWRRVWQVEAIIEGAGRATNVVLHDVKDAANKCTLAPQVLLDSSRFRPLGRGAPKPPAQPLRQRPRARRELPAGALRESGVVALPRRRLETAMMIETRSPEGYVVICKHQGEDHRFVAKHPGMLLACPRCGYKAKSMALLLDYIGAARPWQQINAPLRRRAGGARRPQQPPHPVPKPPASVAEGEPPSRRSRLAFLRPRKPSPV